MFDISQYLHIRSAFAAAFAADGAVTFRMDTTGVPQVWRLDAPGAWPEQVMFADERVTLHDPSPTRNEIAVGMDAGGDERTQFSLLDLDTGGRRALTDHPAAQHRWGGWSPDGDRVAFAANRRDESVFDVYVQGRDDPDATRVHEGDGWLSLAGWAPGGDRVLVHEAYSNFDQDVYVLDVSAGELAHVTPHDGDVRYWSVEWAPGGDALYLTTDDGADTLHLARLDLDTLECDTVVRGGDWNVDGVSVHADTGRIAYTRNVDGFSELTVGTLDGPATIADAVRPDLPHGVYSGVEFDDDADRVAVTVSARTHNPNVYVVDLDGTATRWTVAATAGIPPDTFVAPETVRYGSFDGREIPAFLSLPRDHDGDLPVIVDVHGGPESQRRPSFSAVTQYFLANGYAVFEPNVRGSTGYGKAYTRLDDVTRRMDAVADLDAGVSWLHDHPAIDPDRVVALGASYGGFMVLAALTEYPDRWAAGIDIVGIANFVTFLENTGEWRRSLREAEYGSLDDDREFLESISPINTIDRIRAPLLVLHGENDPRVPVGEAHQIAERAAEHVPVEKLVFDDEGHGFSRLENRVEAYARVVAFLDEHV